MKCLDHSGFQKVAPSIHIASMLHAYALSSMHSYDLTLLLHHGLLRLVLLARLWTAVSEAIARARSWNLVFRAALTIQRQFARFCCRHVIIWTKQTQCYCSLHRNAVTASTCSWGRICSSKLPQTCAMRQFSNQDPRNSSGCMQ